MSTQDDKDKGAADKAGADKTGGAKLAQAQQKEVEAVVSTDPTEVGDKTGPAGIDLTTAGVGDRAVLVGIEDSVAPEVYEITDGVEYVTLQRDLVEEFFFPDTKRPAYRLLYTKGQVVPKGAIEAYNAQVERAAMIRENDGVDPANPANLDPTTLASGTRTGAEVKAEG